jgi:hypothetical protein
MRVLVATARYDPLNMCEGDALVAAQLPKDLAVRMTTKCYESGHIVYRDPAARLLLLHDISAFIRQTMAPHVAPDCYRKAREPRTPRAKKGPRAPDGGTRFETALLLVFGAPSDSPHNSSCSWRRGATFVH